MASLGHVAIGMAAARIYPSQPLSGRAWLGAAAAWSALSLLPDADVIGFALGVEYGDEWGHRGATHSLLFSVALGSVLGLAAPLAGLPRLRTALTASAVLASHALLDTMTTGGLGCTLFWPFDLTRYFAPWRPIPVAPIGLAFLSPYGLTVASVELLLFAPLLWLALTRRDVRRRPLVPALVASAWLVLSWGIASIGTLRDAIVGMVLREDTEFVSGFSEKALDSIEPGQLPEAVRARLGEPFVHVLIYSGPPNGCVVFAAEDAVVSMGPAAECRRRGVASNMARAEVVKRLGEPAEWCWLYSRSPSGRLFRARGVCFENGRVSVIVRQWYRD